ncbi:hypothetical protein H9I32_09410 [Bacillus sp. Xin]|uniref:hypothetical protein n=1 Tax=unclassified Bacillus (in: firmicutes) TaxID=185979 RepID=UPI0015742219|nr:MULTISPECIES: hypothetical protein [unclassified Bacillus (in: firmicutes)]MBC6972604.1 hypothetical protein [Bacillus sp. Xin]NSW39522.1 hypothetical protein [Bacillus sp. Xin1]
MFTIFYVIKGLFTSNSLLKFVFLKDIMISIVILVIIWTMLAIVLWLVFSLGSTFKKKFKELKLIGGQTEIEKKHFRQASI